MFEFTVRLRTWLCPYWERVEHAQQFLCQISFLVVASSCPEDPLLEKTLSPEVIFTSLFSGDWKSLTFLVKRENSSSLLVVSCRNILHFDERLVSLVTIRLWPAPLVSLVDSFKLFSLYVRYPKQTVFNIENSVMSNKDTRTIFFSVHFLFLIEKQSTKSFVWLSASLPCWCM